MSSFKEIGKIKYKVPQVDELGCSGTVRYRQKPVFRLCRCPCPHTWTLDTVAMQQLHPHLAVLVSNLVTMKNQ